MTTGISYLANTAGAGATSVTANGTATVFEFAAAADYLGAGNAGTFDLTLATAAEVKDEVIDQLTTDAAVALTTGTANQHLLFVMYDEAGNAALIRFLENEGAGTTIDAADSITVIGIFTGITAGAFTTENFI